MTKTTPGNFFEDFRLGQTIRHATPRTVTLGDVALYNALFGARFAPQSSDPFAYAIGYPSAPLDDLLVFHIVFGKTVPDISLNAVANLGYADCRFLRAVYPDDTLTAVSEVIGLRENSSRKTGVVYVRSSGFKQDGAKLTGSAGPVASDRHPIQKGVIDGDRVTFEVVDGGAIIAFDLKLSQTIAEPR